MNNTLELVTNNLNKLDININNNNDDDDDDDNNDNDNDIVNDNLITCYICNEDIENNIITTILCNHKFHYNCIRTAYKYARNTICPYCRQPGGKLLKYSCTAILKTGKNKVKDI